MLEIFRVGNIIFFMAYPEHEGRDIKFGESRNAEFYRLRGRYSEQLLALLEGSCGANLVNAERIFSRFLRRGEIPHSTHLLDEHGDVEPELAFGIALLVSKELVLNRFSRIGRILEDGIDRPDPIPVTDDLPHFTTLLRSMFPPEADAEVMGICQNGLVDGWKTMLDVLGRQDVPLAMFPKSLKQHLARKSAEMYPQSDGIVLPTAISGVQAHYNYTSEFEFPYVSLIIESNGVAQEEYK